MTVATDDRLNVLAEFLGISDDENELQDIVREDDEGLYSYGNQEYLVLTDSEADKKAEEEIKNSLWAFNADFIIRHCKNYDEMTDWEYEASVKSLKQAQASQCESLNALVFALIDDIDDFVEAAIMSDGRGHFISFYDGIENEQNGFYIYRVD